MKHMYADIENGVIIHLMDIGDGWLVTSVGVQSHQRGTGAASRLLDEVLKEADAEGVSMFLSIEPDGTGLDAATLRSWYERKGFEAMDPELTEIGMVRTPRSAK